MVVEWEWNRLLFEGGSFFIDKEKKNEKSMQKIFFTDVIVGIIGFDIGM